MKIFLFMGLFPLWEKQNEKHKLNTYLILSLGLIEILVSCSFLAVFFFCFFSCDGIL